MFRYLIALCLPLFSLAAVLPAISAGSRHSLALDRDGRVYAWGEDDRGQLGLGGRGAQALPQQIEFPPMAAIAAGPSFGAAVGQDGQVWTWGGNAYGQLGDGSRLDRAQPLPVAGIAAAKSVAVGQYAIFALGQDGGVWQWGQPDGEFATALTAPVRVDGLAGVIALASGVDHRLALGGDGAVYGWGDNQIGQTGLGVGGRIATPQRLAGLPPVAALASGARHGVALGRDGRVYVWGDNQSGQLGLGDGEPRFAPVAVPELEGVVAVAAGAEHTLAVRADGSVWGWGGNRQQQLGQYIAEIATRPQRIGDADYVVAAAAGEQHSLLLRDDGLVQALGGNLAGQLGDGTRIPRARPALVAQSSLKAFLDLDRGVANYALPAERLPPFLINVNSSGRRPRQSLSVEINLRPPLEESRPIPSQGYKLYVGARLPNGDNIQLLSPELREQFFQRIGQDGWIPYTGGALLPMLENVLQHDVEARMTISILSGLDLAQFVGAHIYVGYGTSDAEMLQSCRLRVIYVVTDENGNVPEGRRLPKLFCEN